MLQPIKTIGAVLCLVFALSFAAPNAHADSYTATFTCTGTCVSLPTAPDVIFPSPGFFLTATWNSIPFFFVLDDLKANPNDTFSWQGESSPDSVIFQIADISSGISLSLFSVCFSCDSFTDSGALAFSPVATATPEPGSLALMLSGVGLAFAMRKRSSGLQRAS
jgi:hypothetical protein